MFYSLQFRVVVDHRYLHDISGRVIHPDGTSLRYRYDNVKNFVSDITNDEFGRFIKESRGKQQRLVTHYEYDCLHRLIHATMANGSEAHYRYDAFDRRIEKRVMDKTGVETTTEFLWQGDNLIAEMTNSEQYQSYVYEPGTFRPLALLKGEGKDAEVYHYHLDQIGTPLDIITT